MSEPRAAVWKYELEPEVTVLDLPVGASPLHVGAQGGGIFLWCLVRAERDSPTGMAPVPTAPRAFLSVGTGHRHHPAEFGTYIGTAFLGPLVFHVFETAVPA
jgi:hypothetical protein